MDAYWSLIFLSVIQGLTEVFPISSTGHLRVFSQLMNISFLNLALVTGLHAGSLVAIALFFRKELSVLWRSALLSASDLLRWAKGERHPFQKSPDRVLPYLLTLSLVPVAIEGLSLRSSVKWFMDQEYLASILLILNGVFILFSALTTYGERTMKELSWKEYLIIGMIQGVAVLPGISRLGIVLCSALWSRLKWQESVKLAFILAIPVIAGAMLVEIQDLFLVIEADTSIAAFLFVGIIVAAFCSWIGLKFLTSRLLERRKLVVFGYYCIMFGSFSLIYLFFWQ